MSNSRASQSPRLFVEYCTNCGLAQPFSALKAALAKASVQVDLVGNKAPPRMKTFEVIAEDGTVLFSKLETGGLPDIPALVTRIQEHLAATATTEPNGDSAAQRRQPLLVSAALAAVAVGFLGIAAFTLRARRATARAL